MGSRAHPVLVVLGLVSLASSPGRGRLRAQEVLISEFVALNDGGIHDEDGDRSDWLEIQSRSASTLSLDGWYLTDVASDLFKWRFPAVDLAPGESLLVFASGKDRAVPGRELHANFRLSGGGEYLALTRPDGTIAQEFAPRFPPQRADVSYGISQAVDTMVLVSRSSSARYRVPSSGADGADWTTVGFDDTSWTPGSAAVGYDTGEEVLPRLEDAENLARDGVVRQSSVGFGGEPQRAIDGNTDPTYGGGSITHTATGDPTPWWEVELAGESELDRIVLWNRGDCCSERLSDFRVSVLDAELDVVYADDFFTAGGNPAPGLGFEVLLPEATGGRTIRIELLGPQDGERYLSLAEVEVFGWPATNPMGTNNLALGKPVVQSSTAFGGFASRAVDGNTDGIFANNSVTHTSPTDPEPFWQVDLGRAYHLGRAVLWNRVDECCRERLSNFRVYVLDEAEQLTHFSDHFTDLGFPSEASYQVPFPAGTRGQFVGIQRLGPDANQETVLSLAEVEVFDREAGLHALIDTDLGAEMLGVHPGVYLRVPFQVDDPAAFDVLRLRMNYDDGFVAYLNGIEVARSNAPPSPAWDSRAPVEREAFRALVFEEFNITQQLSALRAGDNVLAIHGLNVDPDDGNFLILPELSAQTIAGDAYLYFNEPTPGEVNGEDGFPGFVADTRFSHHRGFYDEPFAVEISTETPGAQIRYTTDGSEPGPSRGIVYTAPVPVTTTSVLRAAAFKAGLAPTNVDTQTFIFLDDVAHSSVMSPGITEDPTYGPQMRAALTDLPSISLVTGGSINDSVEVRTSVELISADGSREFQEDAGVKYFGGAFTNFAKKNFRLYFRGVYGARKLKYPVFEGHDRRIPAVEVFDQLELRGGSHDMNQRGFYMSNRFTDDTMLDMGNLNPHGYFVHLYLNGTYWGQYHLRERWNADMLAHYLGGEKEDYEAINGNWNVGGWAEPGVPYDGDGSAWARIKSLRNDYEAVKPYLDVPHYIDYMLMFLFGNAESEYRCVGPTGAGSGFKFLLNDADGFTRSVGNRTAMGQPGRLDGDGPGSLFSMLLAEGHPDYKILLADRIHKHFFNDGAMTPARNRARLLERCDEVQRAFIAESARWGYRSPSSWESAKNAYVDGVLPSRTATVLEQYRSAGFYPPVSAPEFNRQGGLIEPGFVLILRAEGGRILYTLNGEDPRLSGGAVSPAAIEFQLPEPSVLIDAESPVKVLVPRDGSLGLDWTAVGFDDGGWEDGSLGVGYERSAGYEGLISTDVEGSMYDSNPSVYLRIPFELADPSSIAALTLGMRYDDGFVAYLNGKLVASRNAPAAPDWNSTASQSHSDSQAVFFEDIDLDLAPGLLRAGVNVLAVQGMNASTTSSDLLIFPQLRALEASEEAQIVLNGTTHVQARVLDAAGWSALSETTFVHAPLRVTEIMYHPPPSAPPELEADAEDFEFLELRNLGSSTVSLETLGVRGGIAFDFSAGLVPELEPGGFVLLVRNETAFESRYGRGLPVAGEYSGRLGNRRDRIILHGPGGVVIQDFTYEDFWHSSTDGEGHSLVIADEDAEPDAWNEREGWRASDLVFGSPGEEEAVDGGRQLPADANQDGLLDIGDVHRLLLLQFRGDVLSPPCEGTIMAGGNRVLLDSNADGLVDLADAVHLLAYLFRGGAVPARGRFCIRIEGCPDACVR